jgi:hypothetical protein
MIVVLGALSLAPSVGDVGACGKTATELSADSYAYARKNMDCSRCNDCGITTQHCQRACDASAKPDVSIPPTCKPLLHDGEVCLRALQAASCSDYEAFVKDDGASTPSECDFCQVPANPATQGGSIAGSP